ncbi:hypothetical protein NCCP1664_11760 [Zafaria cholistanensis]|uniref:DUF4352 domain-containing protein n=1 Tax=Zafaria cholistanensis TaxID=1682741 RepID=A0A5A7NPQ9_9MICC|nr:hypothetical protein [Zafaria cholistanensis]GER22679.1 hypothetical protein NCCP1664_11760 [Zafaria cholistanensis]
MPDENKAAGRGQETAPAGSAVPAARRRAVSVTALVAVAALAVGLGGYALSTPPGAADDAARTAAQAGAGTLADSAQEDSAKTPAAAEPTSGAGAAKEKDTSAGGKDAAKEDGPGKADGSRDVPEVAPDARLAEVEQPVAEPVALGKKATTESFKVSVSKMEAIQGKAEGVGEVAGPAVRFVVTVWNTSDKELDLGAAVVTAEYGQDRIPATELSKSGAKAFPATVAAGKDASGTFVFQMPAKERGTVRVLFNQSASEQVVAFEGAASTGKG